MTTARERLVQARGDLARVAARLAANREENEALRSQWAPLTIREADLRDLVPDSFWDDSRALQEERSSLLKRQYELRIGAGLHPMTGAPVPRRRGPMSDVPEMGHYPDLLGPTEDVRGLCQGTPAAAVGRRGPVLHTSCRGGLRHHLRYVLDEEAVSGLTLKAKRKWKGRQSAEIDRVHTAEDHRRRGYARSLLGHAQGHFRKVKHSRDLTDAGRAWKRAVRNPGADARRRELEQELPTRNVAAERYVSPSERRLGPREARVREVAIGVKTGEPWAVEEAARAMAPLVPPGSALVPVPGHLPGPPAPGALALARRLAWLTGSRVAPVLERAAGVPSSYLRRRSGLPGLSPARHAASMRLVRQAPPGAVLIDNVVVSGATLEGARRALGVNAPGVVYARGRDVRRNPSPDERIRRLERLAATGDLHARERLEREIERTSPSLYSEPAGPLTREEWVGVAPVEDLAGLVLHLGGWHLPGSPQALTREAALGELARRRPRARRRASTERRDSYDARVAAALRFDRALVREALGLRAVPRGVVEAIRRREGRRRDPVAPLSPEARLARRREEITRRRLERVQEPVLAAYGEAEYRRATGRWAGGNHHVHVVLSEGRGSASSETHRVWSDNGKWSGLDSSHTVSVPADWIEAVSDPGLALVEGNLTLWAEPANPPSRRGMFRDAAGTWRARRVKQGQGTSIYSEDGWIVMLPDGDLRWRPRAQRNPWLLA